MNLVKPGFNNPIHDAQTIFRQVLEAISSPGSLQTFSDDFSFGCANSATTQLLLSLADSSTSVWLCEAMKHDEELTQNLKFHVNTPLSDTANTACFAVAMQNKPLQLSDFCWGSAEYPETNTTLAIQVSGFDSGANLSLMGPGIDGHRTVRVDGIDSDLLQQIAQIQRSQPLGIDILFTCGTQLMALPRSTQVTLTDTEALTCTLQ
ncbi:MAG: phosphonate C-P lyase system protein PhnH [Aliivibrio sp.]|uniref:phosphonate C-P lyase system protein PhnH n=1 Tax=Aliivibrio sp. TaxID=1872443 RepID=UPI001A4BD4BB|nr:phosphonate C-P lyase system protein PhnH [Aliivibrio sp.]